MIRWWITARNSAAIAPPMTGEITQLAAICPMVVQLTADSPAAATPTPITPPTMECVVDTGAPSQVARLIHSAPAISAAIIAHTNSCGSATLSGATIPRDTVATTSPPARSAPAVSHIAAITIAPPSVTELAPTAGPMLFATSLAPMFMAM
jgi:hypothetical protein